MAIDLKTETPDTTLPSTGFLFGADSQAVASPSVYTTQAVATTLLGSTTLNGATITANAPVGNFTQTWSNAGATFTGLKLNVTDSNSNAASLLMDLQVGGASRFNIRKDGRLFISGSSDGAYIISTTPFRPGSILIGWNANNGAAFGDGSGTIMYGVCDSAGFKTSLSYGLSANLVTSPDLLLTRRAAANLRLGAADAGTTSATVTITIAAPGVVTWSEHRLSTGTPVFFTTTGALPTGITAGTTYYAVVIDGNTFQLATTLANAIAATPTVITTSGSQSGTHTGNRNAITQRLSVQSVTGVADRPGADTIFTGSQGTGTGAGGSFVFQVAPAGTTGSAQNGFGNALEISSNLNLTLGNITNSPGYASPFIRLVAGISGGALHIRNYENGGPGIWMGTQTNAYLFSDPGNTRILIPGSYAFGWSQNSATAQSTPDVLLTRDAANTLALRNGANAQTFNVYNTFTDASNYERGFIRYSSNILQIGHEAAGTGVARSIQIRVGSTTAISIATNGDTTLNGLNMNTGGINNAFNIRVLDSGYFGFATQDVGFARSAAGVAVISNASTGGGALEFREQTAPAAPATNNVRIYAEDDGAGKTRLMARFATGAAQQIAIEP